MLCRDAYTDKIPHRGTKENPGKERIMELRNLTTFMKVAELQNFSQAAEELGYSQSAVTVQIRQLENELGVRLFDRIGKNIVITQYGK